MRPRMMAHRDGRAESAVLLALRVLAVGTEAVVGPVVEAVSPVPAGDLLRVPVARRARPVVPGAEVHGADVIADEVVVAGAGNHVHASDRAAEDRVIARAGSDEHVVPAARVEPVVARVADQPRI